MCKRENYWLLLQSLFLLSNDGSAQNEIFWNSYLATMSPSPGTCIIYLYLLSNGLDENPITYSSLGKEMCPLHILEGDVVI